MDREREFSRAKEWLWRGTKVVGGMAVAMAGSLLTSDLAWDFVLGDNTGNWPRRLLVGSGLMVGGALVAESGLPDRQDSQEVPTVDSDEP